jgi:rhomboid protease GluP
LLVGINCAVFLAMVTHGVSAGAPTTGQLMHWGANNAGSVLINGEWWRIVTAMFVHVGILHLATNMWCLWNLGLLAEPLLGSSGVLAVYILTGAAGNLLSTFVNWLTPFRDAAGGISFPAGAGASGAVFGIAGALIILLKSRRLPVPPLELKKLRKSVIYFAALNLVLGLSISFGTQLTGQHGPHRRLHLRVALRRSAGAPARLTPALF